MRGARWWCAALVACGGSNAPASGGSTSTGGPGSSETSSSSSTEASSEASSSGAPEPDAGVSGDCDPSLRPGEAGDTDGLLLESLGVFYNVRTPPDYDPSVFHPLIVVYAPGGGSAEAGETLSGLTPPATAAGFVVAYADSYIPTMPTSIGQMADIAVAVAERWCIDETRIHYTGDSGGGTTAGRVGAYDTGTLPVASIAPVAGGVPVSELREIDCPSPRHVFVHHTTGDNVFPVGSGFGEAVAQWFADCYACAEARPDGDCRWWPGCADDVAVGYCQPEGPHGLWPDNAALLDFFVAAG